MVGFQKDNDASSIAAKSNLDEVLSMDGDEIMEQDREYEMQGSRMSASPNSHRHKASIISADHLMPYQGQQRKAKSRVATVSSSKGNKSQPYV